jgi:chemotaxis protein MotB
VRRRVAAAAAAALLAAGCVSKGDFAAKSAEADRMAIELGRARQRLAELEVRAAGERRRLEAQLADARRALEAAAAERDRLRGELTSTSGAIARLEGQLAEAVDQRSALVRQLDLAGRETSRGDVERAQLAYRYDELARELERQRAESLARETELARKLTDAEGRMSALTADRDALAGERLRLDLRTRELAADLAGTQARFAAARTELAEAQAELSATRGGLSTAQAELAGARAGLEAARGELTSTRGELGAAREELADARAALDAAKAEAAAAKGEASTAKAEAGAASAELAAARAAVDATRAELDTLQAELDVTRRDLGDTRARLAERERQLKQTTATFDTLVADLKGEIAEGQVKITRLRDRLTVNLVDKILFESGSTVINPRGQRVLGKVAEVLRPITDKRVQIEGHTDNVPIAAGLAARFPSNWELSVARATVVARFLQDQGGLDPARLVATGYGQYRPLAPNDTPEGRAQNRRIEIVLVPATDGAAVQ